MSVKNKLKSFYDHQAHKYHQTRKKYWHEGDNILLQIQNRFTNNPKAKKVRILELGCGSGRLCSFLNEKMDHKFDYVGVDFSQNLLDLAQKDNPKNKFVCMDMTHYIQKQVPESVDFIVLTSSFQHIPSREEKAFLMRRFYKILSYKGELIMVNRAMSRRFILNHRKYLFLSIFKYIASFGKYDRKDIIVPRKTKDHIFKRFYHFFSLKELQKLSDQSGFIIDKLCYIDKKSQETMSHKQARNSFLVARKEIFLGQ